MSDTLRRLCCIALFLTVAFAANNCSERIPKTKPFGIKDKVTKRDSRGRVQVMELVDTNGACIAEVVYDEKRHPLIYVLAVVGGAVRNLGFLEIHDATEDGVSNMVLMLNFRKAIREHCLPLIIPGSRLA